jgi:hypothetical protein
MIAKKKKDLVATGILPVILNRQAGSLSHHSASAPMRIDYGCKTFENRYKELDSLLRRN